MAISPQQVRDALDLTQKNLKSILLLMEAKVDGEIKDQLALLNFWKPTTNTNISVGKVTIVDFYGNHKTMLTTAQKDFLTEALKNKYLDSGWGKVDIYPIIDCGKVTDTVNIEFRL